MYSLEIKFKLFTKEHNKYELICKKVKDNIYVEKTSLGNYKLHINGFFTTDEAKDAIENIKVSFVDFMFKTGYSYEVDFSNVKILSDNDTITSGGYPLIYPTCNSKRIRNIECSLSTETRTSSDAIINSIEENLKLKRKIIDKKLKLALDMYRASFFDYNRETKFLSMINILEVLAPQKDKHQEVISLIKQWQNEIKEKKETSKDDVLKSLEEFDGYLGRAKKQSISDSISDFVFTELQDEGKADIAKRCYNKRSRLVHDGYFDNDECSVLIFGIVREILKKKLSQI